MNAPDRAPGEVETVAELILGGSEAWKRDRAREIIAALDAVRGRSRDDTVTLRTHADALAAWVELLCEQVDSTPALMEVGRYRSWVETRFGAGRAEDKPPPAKDPTQ